VRARRKALAVPGDAGYALERDGDMKPGCDGEAWPFAPGDEVGCADSSWRCLCGVRERDESGESGAW
jgi:hypothetical protein